jgi:hypothetical protein
MATIDIWSYREAPADLDLEGFAVEALDGEVGKVDEVGGDFIIVDTGPWIVGRKVMLPAGVIERVDLEERKAYVDRTKDEIKDAPEFDPTGYAEQEYRLRLADHYLRFYS